MKLLDTVFRRASDVITSVRRAMPARLSGLALPEGSRDLVQAAAAGAILFGFAGAGLGARGGFAAFRVDAAAAGATVSVGWGYLWLGLALGGAAAGALVGAGAAYAARLWLDARRAGAALLAVGALGGILAGATWGSAVARERVVEVRAQQASAAPPVANRGPRVTVVNGPVRLDGTVAREMNLPLLAFMVIGGTVVGTLAARGLTAPFGFGRSAQGRPVFDDIGRPIRDRTATSAAF